MIKRNIPNALTCANLVCGVLGIIFLFSHQEHWAAYCIFFAAGFDFLDGFAARVLKVTSAIGKDLDSLADGLTFGVLPALILYQMLRLSTFAFFPKNDLLNQYLPYLAIIVAVFSTIRLAKFNNDDRQVDGFIGVPTPANGIAVAGLLLLVSPQYFEWFSKMTATNDLMPPAIMNNPFVALFKDTVIDNINTSDLPFYFHPYIIIGYCIVMSFLLISPIPMFALKFKSFNWQANTIQYSFLLISLILFIFLQLKAIPIIIFFYILLSIVLYIFKKSK